MNDNRFIELVNLYVDREITAAETAELEIEIQTNPRRRAIYNQYCKLNRATTLVYDSFRAQAAEPATRLAGQGTIAKFETAKRQRRSNWAVYTGGLAAAACVAFALVQFNRAGGPVPADSIAQAPASASSSREVSVANAPERVEIPKQQLASPSSAQFASLRNNVETGENYHALLTALRTDEQRSFADGQLKLMRAPALFEDGVFYTKQLTDSFNNRALRPQSSSAVQTEFTAFQFQR